MRVKSFIMHTEARAGRRRKLLFSPPHGRKFDFTLTHKAYVGGSLRLPRHQSDFIMSLILETGARKQRETRGKKGWMDGEKMLSINWKWKLLISFASKGKKKKISSRRWNIFFFSFDQPLSLLLASLTPCLWVLMAAIVRGLWKGRNGRSMWERSNSRWMDKVLSERPFSEHIIRYPFFTLHDIAVVVAPAAAVGPLWKDNGDNIGISERY